MTGKMLDMIDAAIPILLRISLILAVLVVALVVGYMLSVLAAILLDRLEPLRGQGDDTTHDS